MQTAPFYADIADGPAGGWAAWLTTPDQRRIRIGLWPKTNAKATIAIFPGRTEFIEKYGPTARALAAAGYASIAIDWRGQGLSDRLIPDHRLGHVDDFAQYQLDLRAMLDFASTQGLAPLHGIIAHSMGGCIALRALTAGLDIRAAVFSAPMWGINLSAPTRAAAWVLTALGQTLGFDRMLAPGQSAQNHLLRLPFADNALTNDAQNYAAMREQIRRYPALALGGPSLRWLGLALRETQALARLPAPDIAAITFLGSRESIVDPTAIHQRMADWPRGMLHEIPNGRHEMLMDSPAMRDPVFAKIIAHFDATV
jgi:lysophospholipase